MISIIVCFHIEASLTFNRDLNHTNQYIVGLALCALGNICSAEMARDLAPEVERLLQFRDPNVRKKVRSMVIEEQYMSISRNKYMTFGQILI